MTSPVVLIPGIGGSILVKRGQEYKTILGKRILDNRWMNITPFEKQSLERWRKDMKIDVLRGSVMENSYSPVIGFTNYDTGIYPYDFKGIHGITNIVPEFGLLADYYKQILHRQFQFRYFGILCDRLKTMGYVPKESLLGMPYDPRLILEPNYRYDYFKSIQKSIEVAVDGSSWNRRKGSKKITLVGHSLGGVLLKWFLTEYVSTKWRNDYIGRVVVVNAPFGGTTMALRVILSGEYYVPMFHQEFKDALQKMSGILMCLPNAYAFDPNEILVNIDKPASAIRVKDIQSTVFQNKTYQIGFDIWRDLYAPHLNSIMKPLAMGDIPCDLFMGTQQWTIQKIKLKCEGELPYNSHYELGDGQVPKKSLELANGLFLGDNVRRIEIPDSSHIDILSHPIFIESFAEGI